MVYNLKLCMYSIYMYIHLHAFYSVKGTGGLFGQQQTGLGAGGGLFGQQQKTAGLFTANKGLGQVTAWCL